MTDNPYSVILKLAKNALLIGRINVSLSDLRTLVQQSEENTLPCLGTGRILKHIELSIDQNSMGS